jgi:hypothetical protein
MEEYDYYCLEFDLYPATTADADTDDNINISIKAIRCRECIWKYGV